MEQKISFRFKQTGAKFVKEGHLEHVERKIQHAQAKKSGDRFHGINYTPEERTIRRSVDAARSSFQHLFIPESILFVN